MSLFMFSCGPVQLRCNYVVYNTVSWSIIQVRGVVSRVFPPKHWDVSGGAQRGVHVLSRW